MSVAERPSKLLKGATGDWQVVIGMEVHAQVTSNAKLFSAASTAFGNPPNSQVSIWRRSSASIPRAMWLKEFMFLSSVRVR